MNRGTIAAVLLVLASACSSATVFRTETLAPAVGAEVEIRVEALDSGNYLINLSVEHLAPPDRVAQGMTRYVVWITGSDGTPRRVGYVDFDDGDRAGAMTATTTDRNFTVMITAEPDGAVTAPSTSVVAQQEIRL